MYLKCLYSQNVLQINAKLAAEKKYKDALKLMGIDEAFIKRKSSGADVTVTPARDSDDDFPAYSHHSDTYRSQRSGSDRRVTTDSHSPDRYSHERTADDASDARSDEDTYYNEVYDWIT